MVRPPVIRRARSTVHGPTNVAEEGFALPADSIATPNVFLVLVDLIVEGVVDGDVRSGDLKGIVLVQCR